MLFLLVVFLYFRNTQGCKFHAAMVTLFPQQGIVIAMDIYYCVQTDINQCKITNWKESSEHRAD